MIATFLNISRGQTTLETLRIRGAREPKRYICIPGGGADDSEIVPGEVSVVDWNERIYDLGFKENWRAIAAKGRDQ